MSSCPASGPDDGAFPEGRMAEGQGGGPESGERAGGSRDGDATDQAAPPAPPRDGASHKATAKMAQRSGGGPESVEKARGAPEGDATDGTAAAPSGAGSGSGPVASRGRESGDDEAASEEEDSHLLTHSRDVVTPRRVLADRDERRRSGAAFVADVVRDEENNPGWRVRHSERQQQRSSLETEEVYDGVAVRANGGGDKDGASRCLERHHCAQRYRQRLCVATVCAAVIVIAVVVPILVTRAGNRHSSQVGGVSEEPSEPALVADEHWPSERFFSIKEVLQRAAPEGSATALSDEASPQHRALNWVAHEDGRQVDWMDEDSLVQRFAVATLYFATGGESSWTEGCNFLSSDHECSWHVGATERPEVTDASLALVELHNVPGHDYDYLGVRCFGDNSTIDGIRLHGNNVSGVLPGEMALLLGLEYLDLSSNKLSGRIPSSLGELPQLQALILQINELTGAIPTSIGQLSDLRDLVIGGNRLTGPIPSEINSLTEVRNLLFSVRTVDMHSHVFETNALAGKLPFVAGGLPNLRALDIRGNLFTGSIPSSLCTLKNLTVLVLSANDLTGTLPAQLGNLTRLREFVAADNFLSGSIPPSLTGLSELERLNIRWNELTGTIPRDIGDLSNLQRLNLGANPLTGTLPDVGGLSDLRGIWLYQNHLRGSIPESIGELVKLRDLYIYMTDISGTLPESMGNLSEVIYLGLTFNQLSGPIPESLAGLESVEWLSLSDNNVTGDMSFLCDSNISKQLVWVDADCYGNEPEVKCDCCTFCCSDGEEGPISRFDLFGELIEGDNAIGPPDDRFKRGCHLM